ncbi:succinylglutamate desuccinylase/aspartoacylase domain-containing protein [Effusibacillus consociatus]|uniref:Succinylglutamate desuccinylase/aspartoacylase family protein n=1 Tax=Effusibacillus consociatus TaxID=1117041 RepID=A0ABV9PZ18_9BACL
MQRTKHRLAAGTPFETSYYLLQGSEKGPVCMVTAGIHGTEIAGMYAAQKLRDIRIKKGTLLVVPIVNVQAYRQRIRGNPDLNRTFPRNSEDSANHVLANDLFRLAKRYEPELCLDLHEANGFSRLKKSALGQSLITNPTSSSLPVVKRIVNRMNCSIDRKSRHFTIRLRVLPGSFRTAVARVLGARAVTVETSMNLPLALRIQYQLDIVRHFLRGMDLI